MRDASVGTARPEGTRRPVVRFWLVLLGAVALSAGAAWLLAGAGSAPDLARQPTEIVPVVSDPSGGLRELEEQARAQPADASAAIELGQAYAALNLAGPALREFQRAGRLDPARIPARVGQAQMWMRLGRPGHAVQAFEWAVARRPDHAALRLELAAAFLELRELKQAGIQARKAVDLEPFNPEARRALATAHLEVRMTDAALAQGQKALDLAPEDPANWILMGTIHFRGSRYPEAARHLRRALALRPEDPNANLLLAQCVSRLESTPAAQKEAGDLLLRALVADPFHREALYEMGVHYLGRGELDLAASMLRRAREADPLSPEVLLSLGQTLVRLGERREGRDLVQRAQELKDRTLDFTALEYQCEYNPSPAAFVRLSELYLRNGAVDAALHALRKARRKYPANSQVRDRLADAEQRAARTEGRPSAPR